MFCKQKVFCSRKDFLYTSNISKILVILTAKPLTNEEFYYVVLVRIWKANFSVGVVNSHNAPVGTLQSELGWPALLGYPAASSSLVLETGAFQNPL